MDLILIIVTVIMPLAVGMLLRGERKEVKKLNYEDMRKLGYDVYKYGEFDYAYRRI